MKEPEVSVIIPTYNRVNMLLRAIRNVLNQTYQDFELIIVDDGSTDSTRRVITHLQDPKINYIQLGLNSGSSAKPRNTGIRKARGKYIALLDSDDEWLPTYLERLVEKMQTASDRVGLVYCGLTVVSPTGELISISNKKLRGNLYPFILGDCTSSVSSSLIKRECFEKAGTFDEGNIVPHWDMWIRLAKWYEFDYIDEALARYNLHENQQSNKVQIPKKEAILRKYAEDYANHPKEMRRAKFALGKDYREEGDGYKFLKYSIPFLVHNSLKWKFHLVFIIRLISPRLEKPIADLYRRIFRRDAYDI